MEQIPQPEIQANLLANRIEAFIGLPDQVHSLQEHNAHSDGGYILTIRAVTDSSQTEEGAFNPNSRYIYLWELGSQPEEKRLRFSIDLDALMQEDVRQVTENELFPTWYIDLASVIDRAESDSDELGMLQHVHTAIAALHTDQTISPDLKETLRSTFSNILDKGAAVTTQLLSREHADGTMLEIEHRSIEGPVEQIRPYVQDEPMLTVAVAPKGSLHQITLRRMHDGTVETIRELQDELERAASYAKEEDIERDDEGNITVVNSLQRNIAAVHAAERAMGLRGINPTYLEIVERYVNELLVP